MCFWCNSTVTWTMLMLLLARTQTRATGPTHTAARTPPFLDQLPASTAESIRQCVVVRGLMANLDPADPSRCTMKVAHPKGTKSVWKDPRTGALETLSYTFNLCEFIYHYHQTSALTLTLTAEYVDAHPEFVSDLLQERRMLFPPRTRASELVSQLKSLLPHTPPFRKHQYRECAVVGNSGDLTGSGLGAEIDAHSAVFRINDGPTRGHERDVGTKTTFRVLNDMAGKHSLAQLVEHPHEILLIKSEPSQAILQVLGAGGSVRAFLLLLPKRLVGSAGGTGESTIEFATSVCGRVNVFGFATESGYSAWTRYFSEARGGHHPLQGRAFYQVLECLGVVKIRAKGRKNFDSPPLDLAEAAREVSSGRPGSPCKITKHKRTAADKAALKNASGSEQAHKMLSFIRNRAVQPSVTSTAPGAPQIATDAASGEPRRYIHGLHGSVYHQVCI
mmetsp:Transcript_10470/g.19807  ORF Transcript_10470/g.19807 Transcript_10470/m.19807 type:complete len:447 (-) Transcript_10470:152-1492(-)